MSYQPFNPPPRKVGPSQKMALILTACAGLVGSGGLIAHEGWRLKGYPDPVVGAKLPTACAGVTEGVVLGKVYTEDQCVAMTLDALVKRAGPLAACVPDTEPAPKAAFIQDQVYMAYNFGPSKYLKSSMCSRMKAHDFAGVCEAITLYKYADNGKVDCSDPNNRTCRGLWKIRLAARDSCRASLR